MFPKGRELLSCYHLKFIDNSHCLPHRVRPWRYPCTWLRCALRRSLLLKSVRCAAPRCIHTFYPWASHQPASFCLESKMLLFLFIAFSYTPNYFIILC